MTWLQGLPPEVGQGLGPGLQSAGDDCPPCSRDQLAFSVLEEAGLLREWAQGEVDSQMKQGRESDGVLEPAVPA